MNQTQTARSYSKVFPHSFWLKLPSPNHDPRDRRFQLRKTFELEAVPTKADICVTADAKYSLYINGKFVNFGPARGFQHSWPFDRIDIAPYLRSGKNVIAALLYSFGLGNFTYSYEGEYGFLLSGQIGKSDISTNETWKIRIAPGYLCAVAQGSFQYGFQEFYDFQSAEDNWFEPDYDDSNWTENTEEYMRIAGCMPWHEFEERAIPLLTHDLIPAASRIAISRHTPASQGWQEISNIREKFFSEQFQWETNLITGDTISFEDGISAQLIDFGEEMVGMLHFEVDDAVANHMLDYMVCECIRNSAPALLANPITVYGGRFLLRSGHNEHELTLPWGFRYVVLWTHQLTDMKVKLSCRRTWYPLDVQGKFMASDKILDKIWKMCEHTQRCCTVDSYIDCPWRENAQWWGDALVQAQNTFRLTADPRILARGLRQISTQRTPNGLTYAMAPTIGHTCILPDYSAMWLVTLWAYYYETGSTKLYEELTGTVDAICSYFREEIRLNRNGLISYDRRYWLFLDWCPGLFKEGTPTLLNLIWLWALSKIKVVAEAADDTLRVAQFADWIKEGTCAIIENLYNPETKLLYDGLDWEDNPVDTHAPHTAAFAILLDLLPEAQDAWLNRILLPLVKGNRGGKLQPSAYFMFYIFQALKKKGYREEVIDCIYRWWGEFSAADCSTTPEGFLEQSTPGVWSYCHAWSAHPLVHFSDILLGVTQTAPGWKRIKFDPMELTGTNISGNVPTPQGNIQVTVTWRNGKPEKESPYHCPAGPGH